MSATSSIFPSLSASMARMTAEYRGPARVAWVDTDAVTWATPVSVTGNLASRTFHPTPATGARYVKLNVTAPANSGSTDTAARIYELEVYGGPVPVNSGSTYAVINQNSGKCVDDASWGTANGSIVQQWSCGNAQSNQRWQFTPTDSGYYKVTSMQAAIDWNIKDWGTANGRLTAAEALGHREYVLTKLYRSA